MKAALIAAVVAAVIASTTATAATIVVTSKNIKNGTIQLVDISPKAKKALRGQRGPQGPEGPEGPQGVLRITAVRGPESAVGPGAGSATAACPAGQQPISGGFFATPALRVFVSGQSAVPVGWGVAAWNPDPVAQPLSAVVYCSPDVTLVP
jgi:hypothetical protein